MQASRSCPECGHSFLCGSQSPGGTCWCGEYPHVLPPDPAASCRCPNCLAKATHRKIRETLSELPHAEALALAARQPAQPRLIEHIDYTVEEGNWVFSRWYLLKQGKCCGSGCRNCPYPE